MPFGTDTRPRSWTSPAARTSEISAREQPSAAAPFAASSATRRECPARKPTLRSVNSPKAPATPSSPAVEIVATGCGSASITRAHASGNVRGLEERLGPGEGGVDDVRVVAAVAAAAHAPRRPPRGPGHGRSRPGRARPARSAEAARSRLPRDRPGTPFPSQREVTWPSARATSSGRLRRRARSIPPSQRFAAARSNCFWPPAICLATSRARAGIGLSSANRLTR